MKILERRFIPLSYSCCIEATRGFGGEIGVKMIWAGTNPDESKVFALVEMQDPEQLKTFGEREDVAKARAERGEDVTRTTVVSPIGEHYMPA